MSQLDSKMLGARIRNAREKIALSQSELAKKVGKDQRVVSAIERGLRGLDATELPLFAEALDVPIMYFFGELIPPSDLDTEVLREFHQLPSPSLRQAAIQIIHILIEMSTITNSPD